MNISQREARRLKKRVAELERISDERCNPYQTVFPGGINVGMIDLKNYPATWSAIHTSRRLGFLMVATTNANNYEVMFYAVPRPDKGGAS